MLKRFSALAALDQHEFLMKNQQKLFAQVENASKSALEMSPEEPASKKTDSSGSE